MRRGAFPQLSRLCLDVVTVLIGWYAVEEVGTVVVPGSVVVGTAFDRRVVKAVASGVLDGKSPGWRCTDPLAVFGFVFAGAGVHGVDALMPIHDVDPVSGNADLDPGILQLVNIGVGDRFGRLAIVDWRPHMVGSAGGRRYSQKAEYGEPSCEQQ